MTDRPPETPLLIAATIDCSDLEVMTRFWGELLDVATDVVWRFRAYDAYGGSEPKACQAIRKRCPGFSPRQYYNAFTKSLELYNVVERLVKEYSSKLWDIYKTDKDGWQNFFDQELKARYPSFRLSTLRGMVSMMFFYWHLK